MKKFLFPLALATALIVSSCGVTKSPLQGYMYTDVTSGLHATGNTLGKKVGRASVKSYLNLIAVGDASIQTAAKSAGINNISHIDEHVNTIFGVVSTHEVIVYGD